MKVDHQAPPAPDVSGLVEALERAQEDINWMINSGQMLNAHVFDYIEKVLADHRSNSHE